MSRTTEDSVTDLMAEYLRSKGFNATTQISITLPSRGKPDIQITDGGIFLGEAEWESSKWKGIAQAHDYGQAPEASGSFMISYPEKLKREITQARLGEVQAEAVLSGYKYTITFHRKGERTNIYTGPLEGIPDWIKNNIYQKVEEVPPAEEIVNILRQTTYALTNEIGNVRHHPDLFSDIIGGTLPNQRAIEAARQAAGYLLVNQIAFYRVLSSFKDYDEIAPDKLRHPHELNDYFAEVLEDNYSPVFSFGVASEFSEKSLELIKAAIQAINGLTPEFMERSILGTVFHTFIPLSVRKAVAAYYTKGEAADILSYFAINSPEANIFDPACGSGTLLASAYSRKKSLMEKLREFGEKDHKKFIEEEITGIDIMPFAAHLSTIHLALQGPGYETDEVNIGIEDSTNLDPGDVITPLSRVLPEARKQRSMDSFLKENWWKELTEKGSVGVDGKAGRGIELNNFDIVIMNPPFTRQETLGGFTRNYKNILLERFYPQRKLIDRKMSYCSYFLLLGDKFLQKDGKIAVVLPATILRGDTETKLRKMFLENYVIHYIFIRKDAPNFSEDTKFNEILFIAEKVGKNSQKPKDNNVSFVILHKLDSSFSPSIKHASKVAKSNDIMNYDGFELRSVSQNSLDPRNLFRPVSVFNYELIKIWDSIAQNEKLAKLGELNIGLQRGPEHTYHGGNYSKMSILDPERKYFRKDDLWVIKKETNNSIIVKHRQMEDEFEIPRNCVYPNLRRITNTNNIDVSNYKEHVIHTKFPDHENFLLLGETSSSKFSEIWKRYLEGRRSHLALCWRFDITASGTSVLSYYSSNPRVFSKMMWVLKEMNKENAKILSLWYNSSLNILQSLIERFPTRGGWLEIFKYIYENMYVTDPTELSSSDREEILNVFDEIRKEEFPSIWQQLAMNTNPDRLTGEEKRTLAEVFEGFDNWLGRGFEPRKKIDKAILSVLRYPDEQQNDLLEYLYLSLLREIETLKKMMQSD